MLAVLLLQAVFGVADPAQRFNPVAVPGRWADPCGDRGPVGHWVKMSADGAPASIHGASWLDSAALWTGTRLLVALRKANQWHGTAFDPCANAWSPVPDTAELPRTEPWPAEGFDRPFQPSHAKSSYDGFERIRVWDVTRKTWVEVKSDPPPIEQRGHYAVALAGGKLLVWGGWSFNMTSLGDGAVLDLARKSWKKMSATGAPSPRLEPTAVVWTGSRLLVWGGRFATSPSSPVKTLGDGAMYDPARDKWTPMSNDGAPSPRTFATVAWTGRKLVVLGGVPQVGGQPLRDGGVYDPATDRWTRVDHLPGDIQLPRENVGPLTRIFVAPDGRVVFLPDKLTDIAVLDPDHADWSTIDAGDLGKRGSYRALLVGRRLMIWGGVTLIAEHLCGQHIPGQPQCDPWAETAPNNDGWMILLPK